MKLHTLLLTASLSLLTIASLTAKEHTKEQAKVPGKIRFTIWTDLHHDLMPGAPERLRAIVAAAEKSKSEFLIDLGDIAFPLPANRIITDILDSVSIEKHHLLGNHDMDRSDKQTYMDYIGMPAPHYYFDKGQFRFILLDTNFFVDKEGTEHPYANGNYYGPGIVREHVSAEQVEWLKKILADTTKICVIFTHAPLNDQYSRVEQYAHIHRLITEARDNGTRIAAVLGGHNHSDSHYQIDGINYLQINSASYIWGGDAFQSKSHYPDTVYARYPSLQYIIPYREPLYAIVEIDARGKLTIQGLQGSFLPPAPDPAKLASKPYNCTPSVQARKLKF